MNSKKSKTSAVPDCRIADHFPDVRKMVESHAVITDHFVGVNKMITSNTAKPIKIKSFGIDIWESVFNSDSNCGEFAIIEQDTPATFNPIEFDGIRILSTLETQP